MFRSWPQVSIDKFRYASSHILCYEFHSQLVLQFFQALRSEPEELEHDSESRRIERQLVGHFGDVDGGVKIEPEDVEGTAGNYRVSIVRELPVLGRTVVLPLSLGSGEMNRRSNSRIVWDWASIFLLFLVAHPSPASSPYRLAS